MRITGGYLRGRVVRCPPGEIRPAMDRMRESLFAILGDITGTRFLDLFAGSGVVALEACSRGAAAVTAVERDRRKRGVLEANLALCDATVRVFMVPAERFLLRAREAFEHVFCDPPFEYPYKHDLLVKLSRSAISTPGTTVLLHHRRTEAMPATVATLERTREQAYGGSLVTFYRVRR